jgi:hypothetical protein
MVPPKMRSKLVSVLGADGHISGSDTGFALTSSQSEYSNRVNLVKGSKIEDSTSTHSTLGKSILKKDAQPSLIYPIATNTQVYRGASVRKSLKTRFLPTLLNTVYCDKMAIANTVV